MPWHIVKHAGQCPASTPWAVVKEADGKMVGCHESREKALRQLAALNAQKKR